MKSIRGDLLRWVTLGVTVSVLVAGGLTYAFVRRALVSTFDEALRTKVQALCGLLVSDGSEVELVFSDELMPEFDAGADLEYFEVWVAGKGLLERSRSLGSAELPQLAAAAALPAEFDLMLPDGRSGRVSYARVSVHRDDEADEGDATDEAPLLRANEVAPVAIVAVARSRRELDSLLATLLTGILIATGGLGLAVLAIVTASVQRGLRPLHALGDGVEAIDETAMHERLAVDGLPRELRPIANRINDLMIRVERALARERRTTANVAHELRTPIAELRSLTEVAQQYPEDSEFTRDTIREAGAIALQMEALVTTLLQLARFESKAVALNPLALDLAGLVDEAWHSLAGEAELRGIRCSILLPPRPVVRCDPLVASVVLSNALGNAVRHAPAEATVLVAAEEKDGGWTVAITNPTDALEEGDLERLTEPLWKKDEARTSSGHFGLGLALVDSLASAAGLELGFCLQQGRLTVSVAFRAAGAELGA